MVKVICNGCGKIDTLSKKRRKGVVCRDCKEIESKINYQRICQGCGDIKKVKSQVEANGKYCKTCFNKNKAVTHIRTCIDCGDKRKVRTIKETKSLRCNICSAKKRKGSTTSAKRIRYYFFCRSCPTVTIKTKNHVNVMCPDCRAYTDGRKEPYIYYDLKEMKLIVPKQRWYAICPKCDDEDKIREVSSKENSGKKLCKKHRVMPKGKDRKKVKSYNASTRKPRTKEVSQASINSARDLNRKFKEQLAKEAKKAIPKPSMSDKEMIAKFLETNIPSIELDENEKYPHVYSEMWVAPTMMGGKL